MSDHDPRVLKHIEALYQVGRDVEKFIEALDAIRLDKNLPNKGRIAILKTLAQEQAIGYYVACTGQEPKPPPQQPS